MLMSDATNGTYSRAVFANGSWIFTNLTLSNSFSRLNLTVSARDSNVTIFSFGGRPFSRLYYNAQGKGLQVFNFGIGLPDQYSSIEWSVVTKGNVFLSEGQNWNISHDGNFYITGLTGNITIARFFNFSIIPTSNLPWYVQHSVAILIIVVVAAVVVAAVIINVRNKELFPKEADKSA